jgi:hypothetical protein
MSVTGHVRKPLFLPFATHSYDPLDADWYAASPLDAERARWFTKGCADVMPTWGPTAPSSLP